MNSPVPQLVTTNNIPSSEEAVLIINSIDWIESELLQLRQEVHRTEGTLAALHRKHERWFQYVKQHRAILSPIRRVPPEIISEIFLLCLPKVPSTFPVNQSHFESLGEPLTLTHVSKSWRSIALSTQRLWSSFAYSFRRDKGPKLHTVHTVIPPLLEMWLPRSGHLPLSLTFKADPYSTSANEKSTAVMLDTLQKCAPRSRELNITSGIPMLNQLAHTGFPLLEQLDLTVILQKVPTSPSAFMFETAPRLRILNLQIPNEMRGDYRQLFKWSNLTHFTSNYAVGSRDRSFIEGLLRCQGLQTCKIVLNDMQRLSSPPALLPHLHTLQITDLFGANDHFLENLVVPSLRDFRLLGNCRDWPVDKLTDLTRRSSCNLKHLGFKYSCPDSLLDFLKHTQSLTTLDIRCGASVTQLPFDITLLHPSNMTPPLLPNLENIFLAGPFQINVESIVTMVDSRWKPKRPTGHVVKCLRTIDLCTPGGTEQKLFQSTVKRMAEMRQAGVVLTLYDWADVGHLDE